MTTTRRSYAELTTLILQILQDTTPSTYDSTETGYWIEESLKEFSPYAPHIIPMIYKIESRTGTDTTGTANKLTDTTKTQFLTTDDSDEKVIHNTTDNTWATATTATASTTTVITLNADIMDSGEKYEIYNKRCWNKKQIYLGNPTDIRGTSYLWIDSVEYPIGTKRNWKVYDQVLEIEVDSVDDSNLNVTNLPDLDVLVRFAMPHRICQMTDLTGAVHTEGTAGGVAIIAYGFTLTQAAEAGDEFHIANHRTLYTCTENITWSDATNGNVLYFYPALEATAPADDAIYFTKSTLKPQHEEIFCQLVAARALMSEANAQLIQAKTNLTTGLALINEINKGGTGSIVPDGYRAYARAEEELAREQRSMGERKIGEVIGKMERLSPPRTKRSYPTD